MHPLATRLQLGHSHSLLTVPRSDCPTTGLSHRRPSIRLLRNRSLDIVIAIEWEEGRKAHPPAAKIVVRVVSKATSIRPEHRHARHHERERLRDGQKHATPGGRVVTTPVRSRLAASGEGAAANGEGPASREDGK